MVTRDVLCLEISTFLDEVVKKKILLLCRYLWIVVIGNRYLSRNSKKMYFPLLLLGMYLLPDNLATIALLGFIMIYMY